jgi:hypothetical protein
MIRAFPPGLDYPLPKAWPYFDDDLKFDVLPWVSDGDDSLYQQIYGNECTAEAYRAKWRGFQLVTRTLAEYEDHGITELVIGGHEIQSGLNARIFDDWSPEYGDLVTLLKRPGFRHLELHLFTGFVLEDHNCYSYNSGLLHDALAQAKDLEYLSLRASTYIVNGVPEMLTSEDEEDWYVCPLKTIFPVDNWPRLQHFGISNMLVDLDDLISLLASLPPSLRSLELSHLGLKPPHHYSDIMRAMRDALDWKSRSPGERPQVRMAVTPDDESEIGYGMYVEVNETINSYLYEKGENPFPEDRSWLYRDEGGVQRDLFNPQLKVPYSSLYERWKLEQMNIDINSIV